jgi:hypothetical protein
VRGDFLFLPVRGARGIKTTRRGAPIGAPFAFGALYGKAVLNFKERRGACGSGAGMRRLAGTKAVIGRWGAGLLVRLGVLMLLSLSLRRRPLASAMRPSPRPAGPRPGSLPDRRGAGGRAAAGSSPPLAGVYAHRDLHPPLLERGHVFYPVDEVRHRRHRVLRWPVFVQPGALQGAAKTKCPGPLWRPGSAL